MTRFDLRGGPPPALAALGPLYLLGAGGPEEEAGIGDVEAFAWRFACLEAPGAAPLVLAFTDMRRLMALTRAVNGERPFTLPTEALLLPSAGDLGPAPLTLVVDPEPEAFAELAAGAARVDRRIPALEGGAHP